MTPDLLLSALLVVLLIVSYAVFHRLTNATISFTWASKTSHPEPSDAEMAKLTAERDEARGAAERLRAEMEGRAP